MVGDEKILGKVCIDILTHGDIYCQTPDLGLRLGVDFTFAW